LEENLSFLSEFFEKIELR